MLYEKMKTAKEQKALKYKLASKGLYDDSSGKKQETSVLNGFLEKLQLGHYKVIPGERPDFTLKFGFNRQSVSVGCEITYYFADKGAHGSAQARFVHQWKKFAKSLRVALDREGQQYKHLYGSMLFNDPDFNIMDRFDSSALISEVVIAVKNAKSAQFIRKFDKDVFPLLAAHIGHIYLRDTTPEIGVLWWPSHLQVGEIPDSTANLVKIVNRKNMTGRDYDWGDADEKWLIIYSGADGIADMIGLRLDPGIPQTLGRLCYDRVYVWNKFFESIDEIYPEFVNVFSVESKVLRRRNYPPAVRSFILSPT